MIFTCKKEQILNKITNLNRAKVLISLSKILTLILTQITSNESSVILNENLSNKNLISVVAKPKIK